MVDKGLALCRTVWQVMDECERQQWLHPVVRKLVLAVGLFHMDVLREVLVMLAQHKFQTAPPGAISVIRTIFSGWGSSVIVERAIQRLGSLFPSSGL